MPDSLDSTFLAKVLDPGSPKIAGFARLRSQQEIAFQSTRSPPPNGVFHLEKENEVLMAEQWHVLMSCTESLY